MHNTQSSSVSVHPGALIHVSVRYWHVPERINTADLGLKPGKSAERLISLGRNTLLPPEALRPFGLIENRVLELIQNRTLPHGPHRFLPRADIHTVLDQVNRLARQFACVKAVFLTRYGDARRRVFRHWRRKARRLADDPERLLANLEALFPETSRMERAFEFKVELRQVTNGQAQPCHRVAPTRKEMPCPC